MSIFRAFLFTLLSIFFLFVSFGASSKDYPDQGSAYAGCMSDGANASKDPLRYPTGKFNCSLSSSSNYYCRYEVRIHGPSYPPLWVDCVNAGFDTYHRFPESTSCKSRVDSINNPPDYVGFATSGSVNGTMSCNNGCVAITVASGDTILTSYAANSLCAGTISQDQCAAMGSGYYYNSAMGTCVPKKQECTSNQKMVNGKCRDTCPAGMVLQSDGSCENEKNTCPAGQIKSPAGNCLPGEGQCAAGEARGADGTCKKDSDGDGEPDPDDPDDKSFSGGDNCDSPPSCSGDPIMCGQAKIQWRIDCNTRKNRTISGGACDAVPICTGDDCDPLQYQQLVQQWRTTCALEKLASSTSGSGDASGDGSQPDWTKVDGMSQDPGDGQTAADTAGVSDVAVSTDDLDQSGFGGGSCIGFVSTASEGVASQFMATLASPPAIWCNYINVIKAVFILVGAVASVYILARGG